MRVLWIVAVCVAAAIGVWFWLSFPIYAYRYRLTVAVVVDGKVHSSSSVIEVRYNFWPQFVAGLSNGGQYSVRITGEAVLIDLGTRGALLTSLITLGEGEPERRAVGAESLALRAFTPLPQMPQGGYVVTRERLSALSAKHGRVDLMPDNLPPFIWFKDVADPATARSVQAPDFAAVLGGDARLVSAQIEMTNDPIVIDIDKKLLWYGALERSQKASGIQSMPGKLLLSYNMFVGI
jgi:hypothetical protein